MKKRAKICFYIFVICAFCALGILGYFVFNDNGDNVMVGSRKFVTFNEVPGAASYSLSVKDSNSQDYTDYVANYRVYKTATKNKGEYSFKIEVLDKNNVKLAQETYIQEITSENKDNNTIDCIIKDYTVDFFNQDGEVIYTRTFLTQTLENQSKKMFCCIVSEYFENLFNKDGKYNIKFSAYDEEGNLIKNFEKDYNYEAYYEQEFERRENFYINGQWYNYIISSEEELERLVWHTILYRKNNVTFYVKTSNITPSNIDSLVFEAINNYPEYDGLNDSYHFAKMQEKIGTLYNFTYYLDEEFTKTFEDLQEKDKYAYDYAIKYKYQKDKNFNVDYVLGQEDLDGRNFAIDNEETDEVLVYNTEQLYMVVQYGAKPIFEDGESVVKTVYENAKTVLQQINNSDYLTDYEKALNIYRYICGNVVYDYVTYNYMDYKNDYTIHNFGNYSCFYLEGVLYDLNNQYAVCDGLAKAYTLLCNIEGINCVKVNGEIIGEGNHAWNKVYLVDNNQNLNGWYCVDTTWGVATYKETDDNNVSSYYEFLTHTYFLEEDIGDRIITFEGEVPDKIKEYNYYENLKYSYGLNSGNFYIESNEELIDIFDYAEYMLLSGKSSIVIEIEIDETYEHLQGSYAGEFILDYNLGILSSQMASRWFEKCGLNSLYSAEWFVFKADNILIFRIYK